MEASKMQRVAAVSRGFTPATPVNRLDMLSGRMGQLSDVVSTVSQAGQHAAIYGERGVGKTSLANVLAEFFRDQLGERFATVTRNCNGNDSFLSLWAGVFEEIGADEADPTSPEGVRRTLERLGPSLIVLDELDRLEDDDALTSLADTVKTLSDHAVDTTLVLVGVARSVADLIGEHQSIARALVQIQMPRMSADELAMILTKGFSIAELTADPDVIESLVSLSEGLPHYAHLLGLQAGLSAVQNDRAVVTSFDVQSSIPRAVERHTNVDAYQRATRSARTDALFPQVLLACALAPKNALGFFTSSAVREPLETVAGRRLEIPAFSSHLSAFLEADRGSVLVREGSSRRYFYQFADPIFQPYVVLHGLATNLITAEERRKFQAAHSPPEITPSYFEQVAPDSLF